jgi:hypothetical protein
MKERVEITLAGQGTRMTQRLSVHQAKATKHRIRVGTKTDNVVGEACGMVGRADDVHSAHSMSQLLVTHMSVFIYIRICTQYIVTCSCSATNNLRILDHLHRFIG